MTEINQGNVARYCKPSSLDEKLIIKLNEVK